MDTIKDPTKVTFVMLIEGKFMAEVVTTVTPLDVSVQIRRFDGMPTGDIVLEMLTCAAMLLPESSAKFYAWKASQDVARNLDVYTDRMDKGADTDKSEAPF